MNSYSRRQFFAAGTAACAAAQGMPKTILLRSGWDTVNIGDIGHTPGTLRIFEKHLPDVKVILWAAKVNEPIEAMLRRRFPKVEIVRGNLERDAFQQADLAIKNSSMGTDNDFLLQARQFGKPYGFYGQSYFREFVESERGKSTIEVLNGAAFVYCRDSETLDTLRRARVKSPALEFAPDGCFGIDVRDEARALAFLSRHGLEERKFLTIMLRTQTAKHPDQDSALNPIHPTPQQQAADELRATVYRELITAWVNKTGYKVLIAPEVEKEMIHNKRLLFDPLPAGIKKHVVNRETFWNVDEAASVFARAHTAICHEPHSLIIALANGTPIIHTFSAFHSPKYWMFKDIGLPEWLLEFESTPAVRMFETLMAIHDDYPGARAKVKRAMAFVEQRQASTMQVVKRLLNT